MIDYMLSHKNILNKFHKTEIIKNTFFDDNGINLDISNMRKSGKSVNKWKLKGNGNPLQYSCLENPMDGGTW